MEGNRNRAEAERSLEIAEKLLTARDLVGSKKFAIRAHDADPLFDGVAQILAVADVLLAAEKRINNHLDWYAILQLNRQCDDLQLIKTQYKRLALFLHPDKNKFLHADNAFKLVADAWAVLSNPSKKSLYDNELNLFAKFDSIASNIEQSPQRQQQQQPQPSQQPVRRSHRNKRRKTPEEKNCNSGDDIPPLLPTFWTACPYCYNLYEYPRVYEECCLRCVKCKRGFHAVMILSPPPAVPGKEAYYCCWGFFPLAFSMPISESDKNEGFPTWMPFCPMFSFPPPEGKWNTRAPKASLDDQDSSVDILDEQNFSTEIGGKSKRRTVNVRERSQVGKAKKGDQNFSEQAKKDGVPLRDGFVAREGQQMEMPQRRKKTVAKKTKKQMGKGSQSGKLGSRLAQESGEQNLNMESRNEANEPAATMGEGAEIGSGDGDVAGGIGFFEGLDGIMGSLPILSIGKDGNIEAV